MRISGGKVGLTAVVVGLRAVVVAADSQRVDFNKGFNDGAVVAGTPSAIFNVTTAQMTRIFGWQIASGDSLKVNTINLFVINGTNHDQIGSSNQNGAGEGNGIQTSLPFPGPFPTPTFTGRPQQIPRKTKRAETGLQGSLKVGSTERGGTVTIDSFQSLINFQGLVMYFEAVWPENDGRSYSRAFTVVDGANPNAAQSLAQASRFTDPNPVVPQSGGNGVGIATGTSTPITAAPESSSSSGGLAAGAIAGIVVGGVVGLVLICAAVWFLCIRRRSQANDEATLGSYGNARRRTDELIAEKEANAGVDVAPHSPYSDDGGGVIGGGRRRSSSLHNVDPAAIPPVTSHHRELSQQPLKQALIGGGGSYAPYSDQPHGGGMTNAQRAVVEHGSRGGSPVPANGRTTPLGIGASQYAHLVEEGMTEDEIKRLEEEERALDAAIEQAGRKP